MSIDLERKVIRKTSALKSLPKPEDSRYDAIS